MPLLRKLNLNEEYSTNSKVVQDEPEETLDDELLSEEDLTPEIESDEEVLAGLDAPDEPAAERSKIVTEPESRWSKIVTDDLEPARSKKVTARRRRIGRNDDQLFATIRENELAAAPPQYPSLVGTPNTLISTPSSPQKSVLPIPVNENVRAPAWVHTTERGKLYAANRALAGESYAITLNLGPDQYERALASPKGFSAYMRLAIMRALERELGYVPLFWFVPDVTSQGRLHLHGGIACNPNIVEAVGRALRCAGGDWASSKHHDRQLELVPQTDRDVWVRYALGDLPKVRRLISGKGVVISNPLRKLAQELYENKFRRPK